MKNYKKALVAGVAGLLLGLSSMTTFASYVSDDAVSEVEKGIADAIAPVCAYLKNDVAGKFISTAYSDVGEDWVKGTTCYVEGSTTRCPQNAGLEAYLSDTSTGLAALLPQVENQINNLTGTCAASDCTVVKFEASITDNAVSSAYNSSYAGGKKDGDVGLICTIGQGSGASDRTCEKSAVNKVKFMILPVSNRDGAIDDAVHSGLKQKLTTMPGSYDFRVIFPLSGTANGLPEATADRIAKYLQQSSKCDTDLIRAAQNIQPQNALTGNANEQGQHWTSY